jgi:hypothetical protein
MPGGVGCAVTLRLKPCRFVVSGPATRIIRTVGSLNKTKIIVAKFAVQIAVFYPVRRYQ